MEQFTDIKGFEQYEISISGVIRNKIKKTIKKPFIGGKGYYYVDLNFTGGRRKRFTVHRLVAETFIPNPEGKKTVNHIDGNKLNNHRDNLEWMTQSEQERHKRYILGLMPSKIIVEKYKKGLLVKKYNSVKEASVDNNVCVATIWNSIKGKCKSRANVNYFLINKTV